MVQPRPARFDDAGRRDALWVAIALFGLYVAVQRVAIASYDGKVMYSVARNLVDHASLRTTGPDPFGFNTPYSVYGIGESLLVAPAYAAQKLLHMSEDLLVTLVNPALLAAGGSLVHRLSRLLGARPRAAVGGALIFGALTMALQASTELFSEPGVTLAILVVLLGLLRWRDRDSHAPWLLGGGIAAAILMRTDSLLVVAPVVGLLPLFVPWRELLSRKPDLAKLILPVAAAIGWLLIYNEIRYGSPFANRYDGGGFSTQFLEGLWGLLASAGKGLFIFNPVLVLAPLGLALLFRSDRAAAITITFLCLVRVAFYAPWHAWHGGVGWGPRFLLPLCALLSVTVSLALSALPRRLLVSGAVGVLLALASLISVESVWVPYEQWVHRYLYVPPSVPASARHHRSQQQFHDLLWSIQGSHLVGNFRLLDESAAFPLRHFSGGPSPLGMASLATAVGASAKALAGPRFRARR